jgi:hypothetical protein
MTRDEAPHRELFAPPRKEAQHHHLSPFPSKLPASTRQETGRIGSPSIEYEIALHVRPFVEKRHPRVCPFVAVRKATTPFAKDAVAEP